MVSSNGGACLQVTSQAGAAQLAALRKEVGEAAQALVEAARSSEAEARRGLQVCGGWVGISVCVCGGGGGEGGTYVVAWLLLHSP